MPIHAERTGKDLAIRVLQALNKIGIFNKRRAIHGKQVAQAMLQASNSAKQKLEIHAGTQLFALAEQYENDRKIRTITP